LLPKACQDKGLLEIGLQRGCEEVGMLDLAGEIFIFLEGVERLGGYSFSPDEKGWTASLMVG